MTKPSSLCAPSLAPRTLVDLLQAQSRVEAQLEALTVARPAPSGDPLNTARLTTGDPLGSQRLPRSALMIATARRRQTRSELGGLA